MSVFSSTPLTERPASLLCRFIAERASGRFSLASANSRDTSTPNSASSLQPPHFQPSPGGPLWWESQPHMVDVPSAQERVTANATPADAMAWTNADSLPPLRQHPELKPPPPPQDLHPPLPPGIHQHLKVPGPAAGSPFPSPSFYIHPTQNTGPKMARLSLMVVQFHRRPLNWCWHSWIPSLTPSATLGMISM
ncbi:hypothetical protein EYF80_005015 [Liparis tanakae]|uniref:Uncharacterized protein n=1 Tax=Liparis tanakae TaxID=230148 RepID=A0A4Z2J312_9TELE|nr:hypothetical protein EYF80_005015 [Liparis tanakae]